MLENNNGPCVGRHHSLSAEIIKVPSVPACEIQNNDPCMKDDIDRCMKCYTAPCVEV